MDFFSIISNIFKYAFIVVVYLFIADILKSILTYFKKEIKDKDLVLLISVYGKRKEVRIRHNFSLGRDMDNDCIIKDDAISKHHLHIVESDTGYILKDLKSSNGTYLNNKKIDEAQIKKGDIIGFGVDDIFLEVKR